VDGAVKRYRAYLDNTDVALFEAARLLKSQDRFAEAAALFLEISERFFGKKLVWAEATFQLAKLRESHLHQPKDAIALHERILERASDTRFGQLAQTELTRMQALYVIDPNESVDYSDPVVAEEDPFYADGHVYSIPVAHHPSAPEDNGRRRDAAFHDTPVPPVDPFYAAAMLRAREDEEAEAEAAKPARKKATAKKAIAKKAATKKAPAKRKPKAAE
jgi:tetratricopeptide (TPR) repeat protein